MLTSGDSLHVLLKCSIDKNMEHTSIDCADKNGGNVVMLWKVMLASQQPLLWFKNMLHTTLTEALNRQYYGAIAYKHNIHRYSGLLFYVQEPRNL